MKTELYHDGGRVFDEMKAKAKTNPHTRKRKLKPHTANVLIVDDDVDSALLIESVFAHLGCPTVCALSPSEATQKICSLKADLIILDWILDDHTDAQNVTELCEKILERFQPQRGGWKKLKIVTYSSLAANEIGLLESPHFEHVDHWQKPIAHADLLKISLNLLEKIRA